jgi:prevent-host-death family protein
MERVLSATEFKAKCLACLTEIEKSGDSITITRRGRPVAVVGPVKRKPFKPLMDSWKGRIKFEGDIVNTHFHWDAMGPESESE